MSHPTYRVLVGPYRIARKYAESMGWTSDEYVIVHRAHQLRSLDPATIGRIITLRLNAMSQRVCAEIIAEIAILRALWPVHVVTAAA